MKRFYTINNNRIVGHIQGEITEELDIGIHFRVTPGLSLNRGEKFFDHDKYRLLEVSSFDYDKREYKFIPIDGIPNDIEKQIFDYEHEDNPPLMDEAEDIVNHPSHYETGKFECIDVMLETQGKQAVTDFCVCNAFKYLYRHGRKNGVEDLKKARWYLDKAIGLTEGE